MTEANIDPDQPAAKSLTREQIEGIRRAVTVYGQIPAPKVHTVTLLCDMAFRTEQIERELAEARKEVGEHLQARIDSDTQTSQQLITHINAMQAVSQAMTKLQERAEAAERENAELRKALEAAEAVFSIVEPRSDKAEYLRVLQAVRTALAAQPKEKT